jgi:hypothetical protein
MSAVGDPDDWDFSPATPTATSAVAGNLSDTGLIGDIVTALIPLGDDVLIVGGDHTIWQISGDPRDNGRADMITDQTGIVFGTAWTTDPNGTIYFQGIDGIYRMQVNGLPESITKGRIDKRFADLDFANRKITMEWDFVQQGLMVLISSFDTSVANEVLFWDSRVDGWFVDSYPNTIGPSVIYMYDAESATDTAMLLGSRDGFIRQVDNSASNDDGTAISSRVRYAPIALGNGTRAGILSAVQAVLAESSGAVDLNIYTGQTAE